MEKMSHTSVALSAILAALLLQTCAYAQDLTPAQRAQIEQIAGSIAQKHNAAGFSDDITISSTATSLGSNVRFTSVLRIRPDTPEVKMRQFRDMNMRETTQKACIANRSNPAFARGLSYTFAYHDQGGRPIQEFSVTKELCASIGLS